MFRRPCSNATARNLLRHHCGVFPAEATFASSNYFTSSSVISHGFISSPATAAVNTSHHHQKLYYSSMPKKGQTINFLNNNSSNDASSSPKGTKSPKKKITLEDLSFPGAPNTSSPKQSQKYWKDSNTDYDCIIIGGGSGGITFAVNAAQYSENKARILILDYVKPSHRGSVWGLGGSCINVGCIAKKLFHHATHAFTPVKGQHHDSASLSDSFSFHWSDFGWNIKNEGFDWNKLTQNVQRHIKSLNFKYRSALMENQVTYKNAYGRVVAPNTVQLEGKDETITADKIILATGGRPHLLDIPGIEHSITSDDLFSLKEDPGRTLVLGAGYIAMECAGFLNSLPMKSSSDAKFGSKKRPVSIMVRSKPLRSFDKQSVTHVVDYMRKEGVQFLNRCTPVKIEKVPREDGQEGTELEVFYKDASSPDELLSKRFDTVLTAVGRDPQVETLCDPESIGLKVDSRSRKIITNKNDESSVKGLYAVGDIVHGGLELTPVAIQAGQYLAQRMFKVSKRKLDMNLVPTTIFTPKEYSSIGLSEEQAVEVYSAENLRVYHKAFNILENALSEEKELGFMKLITVVSEDEKVVGFHYVGPNAGEVAQSAAVAMRLGATKEDFDATVGIHPTCAEQMTTLRYGVTEDTGC